MKINRLMFFLGVFVVLSIKNTLALSIDVSIITPKVTNECGWCGTSCVANSAGKVCPMIAPPSGKSCVKQNGACTIVTADRSCSGDLDCSTNEYCYQPPMPICPTGAMCKLMMPMRVCRSKTEVGVGQVCGGLRGIRCVNGLTCEYPKTISGKIVADQTGVCVSGVVNKCGWCGLSCGPITPNMACTKIAPPEGKMCVSDGNGCAIRTIPLITGEPSCVPVPACVDGIVGTDGNIVYCDLSPGVIYCPRTTPTGSARLLGDANQDGKVDLVDFAIWKRDYIQFANTEPEGGMAGDFDKSGKTDLVDFGIWKKAYVGLVVSIRPSPTIISESDKPDLIAANFVTESSITPGMFTVKTVIGNDGVGRVKIASGFKVNLYVDPEADPELSTTKETTSSVRYDVLEAGSTISSTFDVSLKPGYHYFYTKVDVDSVIAESDETNNISYSRYWVKETCGWCGNSCTRVTNACSMVPEPAGKSCITENNSCIIRSNLTSIGDRACNSNDQCLADEYCGYPVGAVIPTGMSPARACFKKPIPTSP
jgi:hypothetical protein